MIIRITQDKRDQGYRIQLADGLNRTEALMQSRRFPSASTARHDARRMFGPLTWQEPIAAGCQLDFVIAVAQAVVMPLKEGE